MNKRCLILVCAAFTLLCGAAVARAQDSSAQESVADAARKAQAAKKDQPKPAKVYTNDNIGAVQGQVSVVGSSGGSAAASAETGTKAAASAPETKDEAYYRKKFGELYHKLADDQKELDLLQREYNLKQQQYYSDPNTAMKEQYTRQDLNDTQTKIDDKKQDIADDQQKISDLEDDLRQNGGDPGWERDAETPAENSSPAETAAPPPAQQPEVTPSDTNAPPPAPPAEPSTSSAAPPPA